ncbi:MAG: 50S ribosomal protein L15 [Parcubacteria group bacterium GW2011_GWA1_40_21]|nr:MAG: 50S ribosomal protein L15 [Parcubacteria group bacterium GW2011_GWC1_40_13]KKR53204.1 MAG: 50S ribosomal protein L15 [Parcubacteria group bacterium GW2011_GWA1_40_21]
MQTHNLKRKNPNYKSARVGRGGKRGKTSGRGTKGQNARAGRKKRPEMRDIIKKIPKMRGYRFNTVKQYSVWPVNLSVLEKAFSNGSRVTPSSLVKMGVIELYKGKNPKVKILGTGEIVKKLNVSGCAISGEAKAKIEKAGGTVKEGK